MSANDFNGGNWFWCILIAMAFPVLSLASHRLSQGEVQRERSPFGNHAQLDYLLLDRPWPAVMVCVKNFKDPYANDYLLTMPAASRLPSLRHFRRCWAVSWGLIIAILIVVIVLQIVLNKHSLRIRVETKRFEPLSPPNTLA
jgi:hypothetical protein